MLSVSKISDLAKSRGMKSVEQIVAFTLGFSSGTAKKDVPKLTLHLYDHCPYCVRVELALGLKGIDFQRVVYGYGDSLGDKTKGKYYGGKTLSGFKMLPVLEIEGRTPAFMGESSNIISFIEGLVGDHLNVPQLVPVAGKSSRKDLLDFFASEGPFKRLQRILTRPRVVEMSHLKDWARTEDVAYAMEKYEKNGFSYAEAKEKEVEARKEMEGLLVVLDKMLNSEKATHTYTWDDIFVLPELRTLSCAPGLRWPPALRRYLGDSLKRAGVGSYFPS